MGKMAVFSKLHTKRGASISYALAFFIVAAMVSATIISASVTAVRRTTDEKERMQAKLTLESCAKMMRTGLSGTTGEVTDRREVDTDGNETSKTLTADGTTGKLSGVAGRALAHVVGTGTAYNSSTVSPSGDMTIEITGDDTVASAMQAGGTEAVTVTYTMDAPNLTLGEEEVSTAYRIVMTFTLTGKSGKTYTTMLTAGANTTAPADWTTGTTGGQNYKQKKITVKWTDFSMSSF